MGGKGFNEDDHDKKSGGVISSFASRVSNAFGGKNNDGSSFGGSLSGKKKGGY
jgi:hypothetical protein